MRCPNCQAESKTFVIGLNQYRKTGPSCLESRPVITKQQIRRRYQCESCQYRFTTYERLEGDLRFKHDRGPKYQRVVAEYRP